MQMLMFLASHPGGFIGFEDNGKLIISPVSPSPVSRKDGYRHHEGRERRWIYERAKDFPRFHRNAVLLQAIRR